MRGLASTGAVTLNWGKVAPWDLPYAGAVSAPHGESLMLTRFEPELYLGSARVRWRSIFRHNFVQRTIRWRQYAAEHLLLKGTRFFAAGEKYCTGRFYWVRFAAGENFWGAFFAKGESL